MGRLSQHLNRANDAIATVEHATIRDVEGIIERTKEVHALREDAMLKKRMNLDDQVSDIKEFAKDLEAFGKNDDGRSSNGESWKPPVPK